MSSKLKRILLTVLTAAALCSPGHPALADVTGRPHDLSLDNPQGHCINCHDLHQTGLGIGFAHNLKRANEIAVCYQCHAGALSDYTSIDPSFTGWTALISQYDIRSEFQSTHIHFPNPPNMDGEMNKCSNCHNPHGVFDSTSTTRLPKLLSAGPDVVTDSDEFCFVCHNNDPSPPHVPFTNVSVGDQYMFSRTIYNQMTHSTFSRATTLTEPIPDTANTYDDNPYGKGKDISCLACHRPHGSAYKHMLKATDDQDFCLACHNGSKAATLGMFTTSGHGKAGVDRICQECHFPHGTGQENAVKTTITDPHTGSGVAADVNGQGMNEACFACHGTDPTPAHYAPFDSGFSGWLSYGTAHAIDNTTFFMGGGSMKHTRSVADVNAYSVSGYVAVAPSTPYTLSSFMLLPSGVTGGAVFIRIYEYNATYAYVKNTTFASVSGTLTTWQRYTASLSTAASTAYVRIYVYLTGVGTAYWDELRLTADGSEGYFRGRSAYEASAHDSAEHPVDPGSDYAPGECANCHDVHGTAANYGKMLVNVADQTLCYDCHDGGVGGVPDVQSDFARSSTHDLAQVRCVDCHNVHEATANSVMMDPYADGMLITDVVVFCLSCHDGAVPPGVGAAPDIGSEWTDNGHDATKVLDCMDCHENHGSSNGFLLNYQPKVFGGYTASFASGIGFTDRAFCLVCHKTTGAGYKGAKQIPTGVGYVSQHLASDTTPCSDCHSLPHDPRLSNYTGTGQFYTSACLDCHKAGEGNPYPDTDAQFNTPANGADADTRVSAHDITYDPAGGTVDCEKCHGAEHEDDHDSANRVVDPDTGDLPIASISSSNDFCLRCHDDTPISMGGKTPPDIMDTYTSAGHGSDAASLLCSECHVYHGSQSDKLLRQTINGQAVLSTYSGNNASVCAACHMDVDPALPKWPGYAVYTGSIHAYGNISTGNLVKDGRHGPGVCVNCHNPHGKKDDGQNSHSMLNKDEENLCYTCHASGYDNFNTAGSFNDKWTRQVVGIYPLDIAKVDGTLHLGRTVVPTGMEVYQILESSTAYPDMDCEISIRMKVPEITRADGYAAVGLHLLDVKDITQKVTLFFRASTNPQAWRCNDKSGGTDFALFGDESTTYHTLKLVRNAGADTVAAYIDGNLVRTCALESSGYLNARLYCYVKSTTVPVTVDVYFDDFSVVYANPLVTTHNTMSGDDVMAAFVETSSHHNISDADQLGPDGLPGTADDSKIECVDCHDPHTITKQKMAYRTITSSGGQILAIEPVITDQSFCIKCHGATPPPGVLFPAGGVWDKTEFLSSAHGNHLMRDKTFGNYSNGQTYACKVCHHPHGSNQVAQQRENYDISRDGIPDDIDGDGVLDSPDLVGFMGFSGCDGPPIFVTSTTGRPDSACFDRISSTLPYQANGSIDVELCLNCHDGTPAPDVETDFMKFSHHDVKYADQVTSGGSKIECYNCHDQHRAQFPDESAGHYATTDPFPPKAPMPGDAPFCLRCHDNVLPPGVSFGSVAPKNIKLSYNPTDKRDGNGYDVLSNFTGHFDLGTGIPLMCRECHNQHGSIYAKQLRDDTLSSGAYYDASQPIQEMTLVALRPEDSFGGSDSTPLSTTPERCLACHSGSTTYLGGPIALPPPPDDRGFSLPPVGRHPDLKPGITAANEVNGHIYSSTFAVITSPGSIKEDCLFCHDSHNPKIFTVSGELMACYQCHNENTALPDVQSEFNDNQTNPTRSKSIHPIVYNPNGNTPDFVECLKCHDQSKHMQGTVRLRKDPSQFINYTSDAEVWADPVVSGTVNQFCIECHGPETTVESNFNRGGPHVPPKLPAGYDSGAHFTDGGLLCTDCHEYHGSVNLGLRKNEFGNEESFCFGCHNNTANSVNAVNIQSRFTAGGASHDVDDSAQAAAGTQIECEDCHNPHMVTRANPVVDVDDKDAPVASNDAFCIDCHDSTGGPGVKFPGQPTGTGLPEWNVSTGAWNRWNKEAYAGSSHDTKGFECKDCHDPHGSANYAILLENVSTAGPISVSFGKHSTLRGVRYEELGVNNLCSACHSGTTGVYEGYSSFGAHAFGQGDIDKNCSYCHNPHGSSQDSLIRSEDPLYMNMTSVNFGSVYNFKGFGNSTTGAPYYMFCSSISCHPSERSEFNTFNLDLSPDNFTGDVTSSSHHPLKEGVIGCNDCHSEHGSANARGLRAPYYTSENWPGLYHSGRGVYTTQHYQGCGNYTEYDGSDYFEMAWPYYQGVPDATNRNKFIKSSMASDANDLCFMCHQKDDIIGTTTEGMAGSNTKFLGHEAVAGGAVISNNIAKTTAGEGTEFHKFSCSTCHLAHSSRMGKLLKQGCFSQSDGDSPNASYGTVFACHPYRSWSNWNASWGTVNKGWRNITSAKSDFGRPPNAVADLAVSSNVDLDITLTWTAVDDQPGSGAHHYNVYRSGQLITQATKPYAVRYAKDIPGQASGTQMNWVDRTCQPGTTYYYAVVACDAENNESLVSNCASESLGPDTVAPAFVDDQEVYPIGGTYSVEILWSDPGDNVNISEYRIYRTNTSTPVAPGDIVPGNLVATVPDTGQTSTGDPDTVSYVYNDNTTVDGGDYSYAVIAADAAGNVSALPTGSMFSIHVEDPQPAKIMDLAVLPVTREMKAQLTWSVPLNIGAISGYYVYRKPGSAVTQADIEQGATYRIPGMVAGSPYTDEAVPDTATDYYYAVTAIDDSSGKESRLGNVVMVNLPSPPPGLNAFRLANSVVEANWNAPAYTTGLSGYMPYLRRDGGSWQQGQVETNLLANGKFEEGLQGWTYPALIVTLDGAHAYEGTFSVKLYAVSAGSRYLDSTQAINATPSSPYTISGYVYIPENIVGGTTRLRVVEKNSGGTTVLSTDSTQLSAQTGWTEVTKAITTTASTAKLYVQIWVSGKGVAYWDDVRVTPGRAYQTKAAIDMKGMEPGSYDVASRSVYTSYAGVAPYESVIANYTTFYVPDTSGPAFFNVTGYLTAGSEYEDVRLDWTAPADTNFTGYSSSGLDHYLISASYDQGASWGTVFKSLLADPSMEAYTGVPDDASTDGYTSWSKLNAQSYASTDALFDGASMKVVTTGTAPKVYAVEPNTGADIIGKTYSLSFWAKANKDTTVTFQIETVTGYQVGTKSVTVTRSWQRFSTYGTFTATLGATYARAAIKPAEDSTVELYLDGVRLMTGQTGATDYDDGSYYRPAGYDTPGAAQSFDGQKRPAHGASAWYRMLAVDAQGNFSPYLTIGPIAARPAAINDLVVTSSVDTSANLLTFSPPQSQAPLTAYNIYARAFADQQSAVPLVADDLVPGNLVDTVTPTAPHSGNMAPDATASSYCNGGPDCDYNADSQPSNAVDGYTNTAWQGKSQVGTNILTLTFPSPVPIGSVEFSFSGNVWNRPKDYDVETHDGVGWVNQAAVTGNASNTPSYTFARPVTTDQVRIVVKKTNEDAGAYTALYNYPIINEFMVYPAEVYSHDLQSVNISGVAGTTYSYAVVAYNDSGLDSGISNTGAGTINTLTDKDPPAKVGFLELSSPIGTDKVILSWDTPQDNLGFGNTGATSYEVYRLPTDVLNAPVPVTDANFGSATLVGTKAYASSTPGTFNNYTATWYDSYGAHFAVRSRDAAGNWSQISNSPFVTVGSDMIPPSPPFIKNAYSYFTPQNEPRVFINFSSAVDNVPGGVNGYRLYRADAEVEPFLTDGCITENNFTSAVLAVPSIAYSATTVEDTGAVGGLAPGHTYYYSMQAWDDYFNYSNLSNSGDINECIEVTIGTIVTDTTAPTWSTGTPLAVVQGQYPDIDVTWSAATDTDDSAGAGVIDHYDLYRSLSSFTSVNDPGVTNIAEISGVRSSYVDNTGAAGTTYYYGLVAQDASVGGNRSVLSNVVSATVASAPTPDNTPPSLPLNLTASWEASGGVINLSWTVSTDYDDGANLKDLLCYKLYRIEYPADITEANKNDGNQVAVFTLPYIGGNYTITGASGETYNFRLEAVDLAGNVSGLSNQATGKVKPAACVDVTPPSVPTNFAGVVGPAPDIDLSWTASSDSGPGCSGVVDHYRLYKADYNVDVDGNGVLDVPVSSLPYIIILSGTSVSYIDSTGDPNTEYWYVLTAVDTAEVGNESEPSGVVHVQTAADVIGPAAVTDLKAEQIPGDYDTLHLTWCRPSDNMDRPGRPGVDHYEIYRVEKASILTNGDLVPGNMIDGAFTNSGECLAYNDNTVLSGHTYSYAVLAVDRVGNRSTISRGVLPTDTYKTVPVP